MRIIHKNGEIFKTKTKEEQDIILDNILNSNNCEGLDCTICPFYCKERECEMVWESKQYHTKKLKQNRECDCDWYITKYWMTIRKDIFEKLKYDIKPYSSGFWYSGFEKIVQDIFCSVIDYSDEIFTEEDNITKNIEIRDYFENRLVGFVYKGKMIAINNSEDTYIIDKQAHKEFIIDVISFQLDKEKYGYVDYSSEYVKVIDYCDEKEYLEIEDCKLVVKPKERHEYKIAKWEE